MSFGRLPGPRGARPFHEINVTPLVDIFLVLLVVFVVSAPLMAQRLALALPQAEAPAAAPAVARQVATVEFDAQGRLRLDGEALDEPVLRGRLQALATAQPDTELLLRVDERVPYGRVVALIGAAQAAGLSRIGFVAEPAR
ncbi:MAG: biopolymer transporter ExbD [Hydrogenophaga sp.]|nr:biopolymer transporter ExbD [Hydrogenophaga sp.]